MKKFASIIIALLMICTIIVLGTTSALAKENAGENQTDSGLTFTDYIEDDGSKGGSALSEGDLTIIVGVACAAVFGIGGFLIGTRKKNS